HRLHDPRQCRPTVAATKGAIDIMLPEPLTLDWWTIIIAGVSTLAIFSFLYRENAFYRFFEHLYIGIATGVGLMATVKTFLWPEVLKPLLGFDLQPYPDGSLPEPYNYLYLLYLLPIAFGSLYYCILSRRHNWLAQLVIGFMLGVGGGLAFKGTFNEMLPQLVDSFRPLYLPGNSYQTICNIVFTFTLLTALSYFFFTFKRRPGGTMEYSAAAGRWLMMGCFGAFFGTTIMARMALLVERLQFLIDQWVPALSGWIIG
ncbi:MAG: hypothetical protein KDD44_02325, partial [Bdellovibrionales bacterium]|nr:hypothetical protein [Bdellovibrionales bacterium]